ncbi:hypothetical protein N9355_07545 [Crocinitomicaceae bacterium]|nr:hypothetical protein [Crocinitomicaceae bacterium]
MHIDVYQNGKLISATSDTIQLQKKPFEFRIAIEDSSGLVLNASTDSASYQLALNGASEDEIPSLSPIEGMSDYNDNKNRSLFVKSTGNNYWGLLMSRSSCDFDQIITSEGNMAGIRTIERISFIDDTLRATHEVNSISVEKLYCVYYAYYRDKNHKSVVLPVKHFILTFSED